MSKLIPNAAILTASRLTNYGVLLLGPLVLVRVMDVHAYGQYQEFMLYAMFLATVAGFGLDSSVNYFLSRYTDDDRVILSNTSAIILSISSVCVLAIFLARAALHRLTSFDFVTPLMAQVFCFANLNWLEYYWIARGRISSVVYYSTARLTFRLIVVITVALLTHDVRVLIWASVGVEAIRLALVFTYVSRAGLMTTALDTRRLREQLRFAGPVGIAGLLQSADQSVGKFMISTLLGPVALGYYAVASYLVPVVGVIRSSPSDVLLPELVRTGDEPMNALRLWQRATLLFCALFFPLALVLFFYSRLVVTTLFTPRFLPAVAIFEVYAFWIVRRCFSFDELLRSKGRTGFMTLGSALGLLVNASLSWACYKQFGLIGPAIALIAAHLIAEFYYAVLCSRAFKVRTALLLNWRGIAAVTAGCIVAYPVLVGTDYVIGGTLVGAIVAACTSMILCWAVAYRLGVQDIGHLARLAMTFGGKLQRKLR